MSKEEKLYNSKTTNKDLKSIIDRLSTENEKLLKPHEAKVLKEGYEREKNRADVAEARVGVLVEANQGLTTKLEESRKQSDGRFKKSEMVAFLTKRSAWEIKDLVNEGVIDE